MSTLVEPTEPLEPSEPQEPAEPIEPAEPAEPTEDYPRIPPVSADNSIPDDAKCQEASPLSHNTYIPCGAPATAIVFHDKDRRGYYMCRSCTSHNVRNRGGRLVAERAPEPEPPTVTGEIVNEETKIARTSGTMVARATAMVINSAESFAEAGRFIQQLKEQKQRVLAFFEPDVKRAHDAWKGLTTKRASFVDPIDEVLNILSGKYLAWDRAEKARIERERREAEELAKKQEEQRLRAEAEAREQEAKRLEEQALRADTREEAQVLEQQAVEQQQTAQQLKVEAASVPTPVLPMTPRSAPAKGAPTSSANWAWRFDPAFKTERDAKMALIKAVAEGKVSDEAIDVRSAYLTSRARADKDTVHLPGIQFYDAGSVRRGRG